MKTTQVNCFMAVPFVKRLLVEHRLYHGGNRRPSAVDILAAMRQSARQVTENTCTKRQSAPVSRGFFASSMGGVGQSVRLAARLGTGFQHPAHPCCLKTVEVVPILAKEPYHDANPYHRHVHCSTTRLPLFLERPSQSQWWRKEARTSPVSSQRTNTSANSGITNLFQSNVIILCNVL